MSLFLKLCRMSTLSVCLFDSNISGRWRVLIFVVFDLYFGESFVLMWPVFVPCSSASLPKLFLWLDLLIRFGLVLALMKSLWLMSGFVCELWWSKSSSCKVRNWSGTRRCFSKDYRSELFFGSFLILVFEILYSLKSRWFTLSPLLEIFAARASVSKELPWTESEPLLPSESSWVVKLSPSLLTNILCYELSIDIAERASMRSFLILEIRSSWLVTKSWALFYSLR